MQPKKGYYFFAEAQTAWKPDMSSLSLLELCQQLELCSYRCEAGRLEMNLAYQEIKRRAELQEEDREVTQQGE